MGGVHLNDMRSRPMMTTVKQLRCGRKILLNSYISYEQNNNNRIVLTRLQFIKVVIEELSKGHIERRDNVGQNAVIRDRRGVRVVHLDGKRMKECVNCSRQKGNGRRRARTMFQGVTGVFIINMTELLQRKLVPKPCVEISSYRVAFKVRAKLRRNGAKNNK
ncbi:hypothetical protein KUTeg_001812 [Tegillarca granosa]|uniref:Uncharacterized protein n=1 Tax=Tegillarca granosa TaxID=220873 RepID=A0ABQ9FSL1_TEGGR|nr:hypothetical protein KUTeg_001812 [Tegillarca granosa]